MLATVNTYATLARLSGTLAREEHLLQLVLTKLVEQELLLTWRCDDQLPPTTDELALAIDEVADADRDRSLEASMLGEAVTLRQIIASVPLRWRPVFEAHRATLAKLVDEISVATDTVTRLLERDRHAVVVPMVNSDRNGRCCAHAMARRMARATVAHPLPGALASFVR